MKRILYSIFLLLSITSAFSQSLCLSPGFGSGMVLQRDSMANIWGWAIKGKTVRIKTSWSDSLYSAKVGENCRWNMKLKTCHASFTPQTICVSCGKDTILLNDILIGDVWIVGGQSNMQMDFRGNPDQPVQNAQNILLGCNRNGIRLFRVRNGYSLSYNDSMKINGVWTYSSPEEVKDFSVIGYVFGRSIFDLVQIPIGLVEIAHGGSTAEAWLDHRTLEKFGEFDLNINPQKVDPIWYCNLPGVLYNKMLAPLLPYSVKGVIFYQGEANVERPQQYARLFPLLIRSWRKYFDNERLPFFYTQIAPYEYDKGDAALLREAQLNIMDSMPGIGMAVTLDVGEKNIIHPSQKEIVGQRLAYWALNKVYGHHAFGCRGPEFKTMEVKDGHAFLKFNYAPNGLSFYGKDPTGFEVAGDDRIFHPAKARITPAFWGNEGLEVWSDDVRNPVAVRYCFKNWSKGCLYNTEGLPASSFRTDNWDTKH